jgi:uncharacterized membrane protein (DUF2068 family)
VLAVGLGLLSLIDRDAQEVAERITEHLHLNPASHYPRIFIETAAKLDDAKLWFFAMLAFLYSVFRFVEAYGLWRMRRWAEWLALVSGGMYMPLEIYELAQRLTWPRFAALLINAIIVAYLVFVLISQRAHAAQQDKSPLLPPTTPYPPS